jgi:hypothetical protein
VKTFEPNSLSTGLLATVLASLACADFLSRDPGAHLLGVGIYQKPETVEGEGAQRELALDGIHARLEGTPRPKEPATLTLYTAEGQRITCRIDSLKRRKKRTPSERERRRLLGFQLADFLTAGGL